MSVFATMLKCNQNSPVVGDLERKVSYDEEGNEIISYVPVDYSAISKENGTAEMWSIAAMLKAGINPAGFAIHTGLQSRIEGAEIINGVEAMLDAETASEMKPEE